MTALNESPPERSLLAAKTGLPTSTSCRRPRTGQPGRAKQEGRREEARPKLATRTGLLSVPHAILTPEVGTSEGGRVATGRPRKDPRDPVLIMRDAGLEPLEPYPGSDKPWRCRHQACGREVSPRLGNIAAGRQGGCRYCAGTASIPPEAAVALMRSAGLEPLEPYPGATPPWRCRHVPCGREVKPRYSYIKRGGDRADGARRTRRSIRTRPPRS